MATILEGITTPTQTIDGVRYFNAEAAILLAAAVSDFGRDYEIFGPRDSQGYERSVKLSQAIESVYGGSWVPEEDLEVRLRRIRDDFPYFALKVLEKFGRFTYEEPRLGGSSIEFDPSGQFADLPERVIGRLGGAHYSTIRKLCQAELTSGEYIGELKGKINGTDLRYFDSQFVQPRGASQFDQGFFLYYFIAEEGQLVAWKTGVDARFVRDGLYTVIGGTVKAHDSYPGQVPKTVISRAKFFDHQTGDSFQ